MKLFRLVFALFIVGGLMAIPLSCVIRGLEEERRQYEFEQLHGSQAKQMKKAREEFNRVKAQEAWKKNQLEIIKREERR